MADKEKKKNLKWTEADIKTLPFNQLRVLAYFIKTNKPFLDSADIKKELGLKEKQLGGIMGTFQKTAKGKSPLVFHVFRVGRNFRWAINKEELPVVKKAITEIKPYLDNGDMDA